ncbi:MAG: ScpA family protein [Candidatus Woesearchaeota archaeon]
MTEALNPQQQPEELNMLNSGKPHHEVIYNLLVNEEEITWQSLLYELVKSEQMDPWDVNVSDLSKNYIGIVKKMQEMDLRVSGKVVLAAAILLKIKSKRLLQEDIEQFDNLMSGKGEEALYEEESVAEEGGEADRSKYKQLKLIPKTPQPRARKVSVYDLVDALQQALEVKRKRMLRQQPEVEMEVPEKPTDISDLMKNVYDRIVNFFTSKSDSKSGPKLTFTKLIPSEEKQDKILTLIPLLHLSNNRKIDLLQEKPFEDIEIRLNNKKDLDRELGDAA